MAIRRNTAQLPKAIEAPAPTAWPMITALGLTLGLRRTGYQSGGQRGRDGAGDRRRSRMVR